MGKVKFFAIFFFQFLQTSILPAQDAIDFPTVLLPSPNSAQLGRYADIKVNHSTGGINLNLPLLDYSTRNLKLPISVSYASNGFRVNAMSSRVGFDWVLNAGGVITRIIRDEADIYPSIRRPLPNFNSLDDSLLDYLEDYNESHWDLEPDIFLFNFHGYTGKFFIGDSGNVYTIPHSNLDIKYNLDANFIITTPDGVKYYFGGDSATESSKYSSSYECGGAGHEAGTDDFVNNAWYLKKITHPAGDSITLTYEVDWIYYRDGVTQTLAYAPTTNQFTNVCASCPEYEDKVCYANMESNIVRIKEINSSSFGKIAFTYKTGIESNDKLLNECFLYGKDNQRIKKIVFEHQRVATKLFPTIGTGADDSLRAFLTKIIEYGKTDVNPTDHQFSYSALDSLPVRLSFAQDYEGFFNGETNGYLVPRPKSVYDKITFSNRGGNREPNPAYASKGLLSQIKYPTGGTRKIDYEGNDAYLLDEIEQPIKSVNVSVDGDDDTFFTSYDPIFASKNFSVNYDQPIIVNASFQSPGDVIDGDHHIRMTVEVLDSASQSIILSEYVEQEELRSFPISVGNGQTYILRIGIVGYDGYLGTANLTYYPAPVEITHNKQMPGIRVKKITAIDSTRNLPEITKYLYRYMKDTAKSSGKIVSPNKNYVTAINSGFGCGNSEGYPVYHFYECHYQMLHSNSISASHSISADLISYESIIESQGDNFENGGTEYRYLVSSDGGGVTIMGNDILECPYNNMGYDNGLLLKENIFKIIDGDTIFLRRTENTYTADNRTYHKTTGIYVRKNYTDYGIAQTSPPQVNAFNPFDVASYEVHSFWKYLNSTKTVNYSRDGLDSIVRTTNYLYDNPSHALQTRTIAIDSKGDTLIKKWKFPNDVTASGAEETARLGLITNHQFNSVIEESTTRNGIEKLTHSAYKTWFAGKYFPEKVLTNSTRSRSMEERMIFEAYDSNGNILELSKENDYPISYIWDYKNSYMVAQNNNAEKDHVAYTSFESEGKGNWTFTGATTTHPTAPTGEKGYSLAGSDVSKSGLSSGTTYVITYWKRDSSSTVTVNTGGGTLLATRNGWLLYRHEITGITDITIAGTAYIDEVRLYPKGALMRTSTFEPLIGKTSECDEVNRIQYFEYDDFCRLKLIKDQDKNIIKVFEYKHQQSQNQ